MIASKRFHKKANFYLLAFTICLSLTTITAESQVRVSGVLINHTNKKGIPNAIIFFDNATIGTTSDSAGRFILPNIKPGKYELVVSVLGFSSFHQSLNVSYESINLGNIELVPRAISLKEVRIVNFNEIWQRNFQWFRTSFLGPTGIANDCKIKNPETLNMRYKASSDSLTVSTDDFLIIENEALGYRIKYLIDTFIRCDNGKKVRYKGRVLFEEMKGSATQQKRWSKTRHDLYDNSSMHFLRAAMYDRLDEEGFRVLQYSIFLNPNRPPDSIISSKLQWYKSQFSSNSKIYRDSMGYWTKKFKLPKVLRVLLNNPLKASEIIHHTNDKDILALGCEDDGLFIMYDKAHKFPTKGDLTYLINDDSANGTLITFNSLYVFFDLNGWIINPDGMTISGAWTRSRVAGLLPTDYAPEE